MITTVQPPDELRTERAAWTATIIGVTSSTSSRLHVQPFLAQSMHGCAQNNTDPHIRHADHDISVRRHSVAIVKPHLCTAYIQVHR